MKKWWRCQSYILDVTSTCLVELGEIETIAVKIKFHEHFIHHPLNLNHLLVLPHILNYRIDNLFPDDHPIVIGVKS